MTKYELPDIDIDLKNRQEILDIIKHIPATLEDGRKHNTGVYCQPIPLNPLTGQASLDYKTAESRGYFKIDFLNVSAYNGVRDEEHLVQLLNTEPLWDLLGEKEVCDQLFHINGYHDLVKRLKPASVVELAMVLALIRPGKKHLIPVCENEGFQAIENEIWVKIEDAYFFKKSHAVSYASVIVVQLNLICEKISYGYC
jgi:DNA polymerase III alpha subunit